MRINDGSKTASQDRYSSAYVHNHSVQTSVEADDPFPCLPCFHIRLQPSHGSFHTNKGLLDSCQYTHSLHSIHSRSSATWCTHECHSCTSSPASRSEWGSRSSNQRREYNSTLHCLFDSSSSRYSLEGIPARVGWSLFAVMQSRARGEIPRLRWMYSCMLVGAKKSMLGLDRIAGKALS
jgi:hypothetical protein